MSSTILPLVCPRDDPKDSVAPIVTLLEDIALANDGYNLIDNPTDLSAVITSLEGLATNPPSLYIDLEGENLCRDGSISILQLYVPCTDQTYLIDICNLREKTFTTKGRSGVTFRDILESKVIPKVFFDVRNDSDALYSHYSIKLQGVQDLQLMELATRTFVGRYVNGLAKCIEKDLSLPWTEKRIWKDTKEKGRKLFAPECGGSYKVFNERPLLDGIKLYCIQDVKFLPRLWSRYNRLLTTQKREKVRLASIARIEESQSPGYQPQGQQKALIPKGW